MNLRGFMILPAFLILLSSAVLPAAAQQRGGFLGESLNLNAADIELQRQAARRALDELDDGLVEQWSNPDTGHAGAIMPTNSYEMRGLSCRDFRLTIRADRVRNLSLTACKQEDGTWKLYF